MELRNRVTVLLASAALSAALLGCSHVTQTTSGEEFLRAYEPPKSASVKGANLDAEIKAAAAVEPLLRFPARIGLARIDKGRYGWGASLSGIPEQEAAAWLRVGASLGPSFGEFVPVSPLVAEMFADQESGRSNANAVIRKIRLGGTAASRYGHHL